MESKWWYDNNNKKILMAVKLLDKKLVMKPRRSSTIKVQKDVDFEQNYDSDSENFYGEPRADKFDEIIDLLKQGNIYGEKDETI